MGRPRQPTAKLELNGAFKKDPQRLRERGTEPVPSGELGDPPAYFDEKQKASWHELAADAPKGVLTNADRWVTEIASVLMARFRSPEGLKAGEFAQLTAVLAKLGMSPADRSRVGVAKGKEKKSTFAKIASTPRTAAVN